MHRTARNSPAICCLLALLAACGGSDNASPPVLAPVIVTQASDQKVAFGMPATFAVAVSGNAQVSYQWKRDGAVIAGATAASYTLPSAQFADAKSKWHVAASNAGGTVVSADARLTVTGIELLAGTIDEIAPVPVDGPVATARFRTPVGVAVNAAGDIYMVETSNSGETFGRSVIRKISTAGLVTTFAGNTDLGGDVDGVGTSATFSTSRAISIDNDSNLYIAQSAMVRKVTPAAVVSKLLTVPLGQNDGRFLSSVTVNGLAVDTAGSIYVSNNIGIRRLSPKGELTILQGVDHVDGNIGTAFRTYEGLAIDLQGNLLHSRDSYIETITPSGTTKLLAGNRIGTLGSKDGSGADAQFNRPASMVVDKSGNVFAADSNNGTIRKITPAGVVTTVAGTAGLQSVVPGALPGGLYFPTSIAIDAQGVLYVTSRYAVLRIVLP